MFNLISKVIINSVIIITSFLAISQVQAAHGNTYDSSACVAISGTPTLQASGGMVNNSTTTTLHIKCPIHRDQDLGFLDSDDSYVVVRDHSNAASVSCSLSYSRIIPNGIINTNITRASTGQAASSNVFQELRFSRTFFPPSESGSYFLYCTIPPKQSPNRGSAINSYYIDED